MVAQICSLSLSADESGGTLVTFFHEVFMQIGLGSRGRSALAVNESGERA